MNDTTDDPRDPENQVTGENAAATDPAGAADATNGQEKDPLLDGGQEEDSFLALQRQILDIAIPHICFEGWTRDVLARAAVEAGLSEADADLAFPQGALDAVLAHARLADDDMADEMAMLDLESMRTRDKIAIAIAVRLDSQIGNRDAIRKGLKLLADPRYVADGAKSLALTVDRVWRIVGDTSTDFNYYTKRGLLAGVYSATLIYWLNDNSEDQHKTREFLSNRISEVLRFGQTAAGLSKVVDRLPNPFRLCGGDKRRWGEGTVYR